MTGPVEEPPVRGMGVLGTGPGPGHGWHRVPEDTGPPVPPLPPRVTPHGISGSRAAPSIEEVGMHKAGVRMIGHVIGEPGGHRRAGTHRHRRVGALVLTAGILVTLVGIAIPAPAAPGVPVWRMVEASPLSRTPRFFTHLASLPDGGTALLYGGWHDPDLAGGGARGDTWTWDAEWGWVPRCGTALAGATEPCGPGTRFLGGVASLDTGPVLYGGIVDADEFDAGAMAGDLWQWNGSSWARWCDTATCGPGPRIGVAMAGHGTQAVLFGGLGPGGVLEDTWVFDLAAKGGWRKVCGDPDPCGPRPRVGAALAWDGARFVLFGGGDTRTEVFGDTWVFDGSRWEQVCGAADPCGPAPRELAGATGWVDPSGDIDGVLLAGGGHLFVDPERVPKSVAYRDVWRFQAGGDGTAAAATGSWTRVGAGWPDTPVGWLPGEDEHPVSEDAPLVPVVAALPTACRTLLHGVRVAAKEFAPRTDPWVYGWDGAGACATPTTTTTGPTSTTTSPSASTTTTPPAVVPVGEVAGTGATGASALARTGPGAVPVTTLVGLGLVAVGTAMLGAPRVPRRRRAGSAT